MPGTLVITDGGNIELEVVGLLDKSIQGLNGSLNGKGEFKRIIGDVEQYGFVTLDDCFYKKRSINVGGISKSYIHVDMAFVGVAYSANSPVLFNNLTISIEGIDEWVGVSGIQVEPDFEKRSASITYAHPEEIYIVLNNGMKLVITFSCSFPGVSTRREAKIAQKTYFRLDSEQERPVEEFISAAHKITTLLCFAIDKTVSIEHVSATYDADSRDTRDGKMVRVPISIYYASLPYTENEPKVELHRMLFRFEQIRENADRTINNWFDAYEKIGPALNLYFSTKTGAHKYLDSKFLALVQALETYHRRTSNAQAMDSDCFKKITESLIEQCPEDKREWLRKILQYGNEVSLGQRIRRTIEPFKKILGTSEERDKFIRSIVVTRNYLTHYDKSLESEAVQGADLMSLSLRIEAIVQLNLLKILGFNKKEIMSVFDKIQWKVKKA